MNARANRKIGLAVSLLAMTAGLAIAPPPETGRGVVAADHRLASLAGASMLAQQGNAVDAVVAAALASGVVQPAGSGLGGGGFAIVGADKTTNILDFREVAPERATASMFLGTDGKPIPKASTKSGLAVAIPAESIGLFTLLERYGLLSPKQVAAPAIRLAGGFTIGPHFASTLAQTKDVDVLTLFSVGIQNVSEGQQAKNLALAKTLRAWVSSRGTDLSTGAGAQAIIARIDRAGGQMTATDLANYQVKDRQPILIHYRGYTVATMPPPSSGGVALAEMLQALEGYDLKSLGHNSSDHLHLLAEVMKHVYADRAHHLGDPDFVEVPVERLLSNSRTKAIRQAIWPGRTFASEYYGSKIDAPQDAGTLHISVIDSKGHAAAVTTTINTAFGSGLVVPELGIILNNQMDDFASAPGIPNSFGLIGSAANSIEPGKRPLSSMTPTIVYGTTGDIELVIGGSGGGQIISAVLQVISNQIDFGMDSSEAVAAPRIHHQWLPDELWVEPGIPEDVLRALRVRGHTLRQQETFAAVQVVSGGEIKNGASDPRKGGWPVGVW